MGIDPGDKGGIACIRGSQIKCIPMPGRSMQESGNELINCIQVITEGRQNVICVLEQAQSMPGQGIVSTFNYGVGYGILRGILISLNISTKMVASTPWKRKMGLLVKKLPGESKSEHKKRCKEKAIKYVTGRWPGLSLIPHGRRVPHDGMADACAIAEFCQREFGNQ